MLKNIIRIYFVIENFWFRFPQKLRYLLVGGFNTVFAYSVLAALNYLFSVINQAQGLEFDSKVIANIALFVQYALCINVSFITMRYYVFQSQLESGIFQSLVGLYFFISYKCSDYYVFNVFRLAFVGITSTLSDIFHYNNFYFAQILFV
jgi:hypothetical protein